MDSAAVSSWRDAYTTFGDHRTLKSSNSQKSKKHTAVDMISGWQRASEFPDLGGDVGQCDCLESPTHSA
jgi:hypothetical protein